MHKNILGQKKQLSSKLCAGKFDAIHGVWVQRPVSTLHRTSVSKIDTFLTTMDTTSFPSCPTERRVAIFEDTQESRMGWVWVITAWRKIVNKGHAVAHVREGWGGGVTWWKKCLRKQYESPVCKLCLYLNLCFLVLVFYISTPLFFVILVETPLHC